MHKILLNIAGILDLLGGLFVLFIYSIFNIDPDNIFAVLPLIIFLGSAGVFLYSANKDDEDQSFNKVVLIFSISNIFVCNIISFILGIVGYTSLPNNKGNASFENIPEKKVRKEISPEEKELRKMRNILGLGVGLVVLSGIIFATSTWESLNGSLKTMILIISAILFQLISILAEKKLKLKVSGMVYYILSNVFITVSVISAGYFEVFGKWFSLNGEGRDLFLATIWTVVGVLSYLLHRRYQLKNIVHLIFFSAISFVYFMVLMISKSFDISWMVLSIILGIGAVLKLDKFGCETFRKFSQVALPILSFGLFINVSSGDFNIVFALINFMVCAISNYCLAVFNEKGFFKVFAPIFTLITALAFCINESVVLEFKLLQVSIISCIIYAIGYYRRSDKIFYNTSTIIGNLMLLDILFEAFDSSNYYIAVIASAFLLATSLITNLDKNSGKYHYEKLLEPIKIFILSFSICSLLNSFDKLTSISFGFVIAVIYLLMYLVRKDILKYLYFAIVLLVEAGIFLANMEVFHPIEQIGGTVIALILLVSTCFTKNTKFSNAKELIYAFFLVFVFNMFKGIAYKYNDYEVFCILGTLLTYMVSLLFMSKNNIARLITLLAVFIPYYWALGNFIDYFYDMKLDYLAVRNIEYILGSIPWLAMIIIYTRGFLKSIGNNRLNIVEMVLLSIWYLGVFGISSPEIGLFIGIVALISILVGYRSEKYTSFYYTGIVFTVINLIVQLKDVWSIIPIWAYILVAGLVLIGVVTYREYVKANPKVEQIVPDVIEPGSSDIKIPKIDSRTIVIGNIIYVIILLAVFIV